MDQDTKQQVLDRLQDATNVLVTVSNNPSVDQLAACIGFSLFLNRIEKRGTAVFSGTVPSTLQFLRPEKTIERNTDSLRDFIISLDKSKADKLRYKVEDHVVKIFITPYRTSLSQSDLDFSQGDFNIDVVLALGVQRREELDQAITAHGRILHDATVISINNQQQGDMGSLNWVDVSASSLCEMVVDLADTFGKNNFDGQIATALLTGIVAETKRFSNEKTSPRTMAFAAELMGAGANQQLIATELEVPEPPAAKPAQKKAPNPKAGPKKPNPDGDLTIDHEETPPAEPPTDAAAAEENDNDLPDIKIDDTGKLTKAEDDAQKAAAQAAEDSKSGNSKGGPAALPAKSSSMILEPPALGAKLTANTVPEHLRLDPANDMLSLPPVSSPILSRPKMPSGPPKPTIQELLAREQAGPAPQPSSPPPPTAPAPSTAPANNNDTAELVEEARDAVADAIQASPDQKLEPVESLGAKTVDLGLEEHKAEPASKAIPAPPAPPANPVPSSKSNPPKPNQPSPGTHNTDLTLPLPVPNSSNSGFAPSNNVPNQPKSSNNSLPAPPPLPPPIMPPPVG